MHSPCLQSSVRLLPVPVLSVLKYQLWPLKYIYVVNVIRSRESEQICFPLRVPSFSPDLCTCNITACFRILPQISKQKKVWDYLRNNLRQEINLVREARRKQHSLSINAGRGLYSAFSVSGKDRRGAFVLFKIHLIMSVAGSLPELVGFKRRRKPSLVIHTLNTQHSGPDFPQSSWEAAPLFGAFRSGCWMSLSRGGYPKSWRGQRR